MKSGDRFSEKAAAACDLSPAMAVRQPSGALARASLCSPAPVWFLFLLVSVERGESFPPAPEISKNIVYAGAGEDSAALIEALGGGLIATSDDKSEGVAAFSEKRSPDFSGK